MNISIDQSTQYFLMSVNIWLFVVFYASKNWGKERKFIWHELLLVNGSWYPFSYAPIQKRINFSFSHWPPHLSVSFVFLFIHRWLAWVFFTIWVIFRILITRGRSPRSANRWVLYSMMIVFQEMTLDYKIPVIQ